MRRSADPVDEVGGDRGRDPLSGVNAGVDPEAFLRRAVAIRDLTNDDEMHEQAGDDLLGLESLSGYNDIQTISGSLGSCLCSFCKTHSSKNNTHRSQDSNCVYQFLRGSLNLSAP